MVCLFGGAFDPPHNGHRALIATALERFRPELLLILPTGFAPHKPVETPAETRLLLAEAAFSSIPQVQVSDYEIAHVEPSYTLETTRWAEALYGEVMFLVGADQFANFDSWHRPNELLQVARLGVATRPGYRAEEIRAQLALLKDPSRVELFEIPPLAISSTEVRELVAQGKEIAELVPAPVALLIAELGLYRS